MKNSLHRRIMALTAITATTISMTALSTGALAQPALGPQSSTSTITADDLLDALVQQGVIDRAKAEEIKQKAERKIRNEYSAAVERTSATRANTKPPVDGSVVRVPYVPQYIKDEIRTQVRMELREEVVGDVMAQAKKEGWGLPNTQEDWTKVIKWSGDLRVRAQGETFASDNSRLVDFRKLNEKKLAYGGTDYDLNTEEDRQRLRLRARLMMKAKPVQGVEIGMRLATGSATDPVSTNQTFGNSLKKYSVSFDRAYFKYNTYIKDWEFQAGRMANPWFSTDLVWDSDVNFDGLAAKWYYLRNDNPLMEMTQWDPYVTVGVFPIEEVELSSDDKWLYALQTGVIYNWFNQDSLHVSLSYYVFDNTEGTKNQVPDSNLTDYSAPGFMQRGNTLFNIRTVSETTPNAGVWGLAADYHELNLTVMYDIAAFSPYHIYVIADYVKNIGYDKQEVEQRVGLDDYKAGDTGYQVKVTFGWPTTTKRGDWQVSIAYKYLERDAVMDGFADSDFHLGGTDAEGYILEGSYGILQNTWVTLKYLSANEVDLSSSGDTATAEGKFGVDVVQLDLNSTF